jgi:hypothetical protein
MRTIITPERGDPDTGLETLQGFRKTPSGVGPDAYGLYYSNRVAPQQSPNFLNPGGEFG